MIQEDINKIIPYPRNAKKHLKVQIKQIANSIREFGFNQPIVIDQDNVIIVGHGRWEAAKMLEMKEVPVIRLDLTEEQAKSYRLADNKLNESDWEMSAVIQELEEMSLSMLDLTGFDRDLVMKIKEDEYVAGGGKPIKTQLGDLYKLGKHRLLCGDSTKKEDYQKLMNGEVARLVFTDPPYGVDYTPDSQSNYEDNGQIMNDNREDMLPFFKSILSNLYQFSTDDMTLYWWFAMKLMPINEEAITESNFHLSQICLWLKNSLIYSPGQNFHRIYEPCAVAWKDGRVRYIDHAFTNLTELWTLDKKTFVDHLDVWYNKRDNTSSYIHPTQKPVALAERALKRSSEENDIVLDAFGGSGSTMMACEQMNRRCYSMELDPKYCDAIVQRYVDYTSDTNVIKNDTTEEWEISESNKKNGKSKSI